VKHARFLGWEKEYPLFVNMVAIAKSRRSLAQATLGIGLALAAIGAIELGSGVAGAFPQQPVLVDDPVPAPDPAAPNPAAAVNIANAFFSQLDSLLNAVFPGAGNIFMPASSGASPLSPGSGYPGLVSPGQNPALPGYPGTVSPGYPGTVSPGYPSPVLPGQTSPVLPGQTSPVIPGQTGPVMPGQTSPVLPGQTGPVIPGQTGPVMPGQTSPVLPGQTSPVLPGQTGPVIPGQSNPAVPAGTGPVV
jgi:hypothetical protein